MFSGIASSWAVLSKSI